ncbi:MULTISPECIES: transporter [Tenacibaculum]|uniref:transporter n=1 Tax=Tenacibaculum TaxID=104267 RepID=UPI001F0B5982|nr:MULTISPECIES: transporter [Tenacibaculum]MCH3880916.1 transporter [Tenacibaculum aquimarinum]MDO6599484.1 transporter [Tenacibaculum sp. 1_MG-2023]
MKQTLLFTILLLLTSFAVFSQDENKSNIQTYTPSKLLNKGQWDIKWFNNLYTETKFADSNGDSQSKARENYFTSTIEAFTGISDNNSINVGAIIEFRSNTIAGREAFSVFSLDDTATDRKGITSIAPAIKWQPIKDVGNFSIQSAFHIPLVKNETENGVFLDQSSWIFQNRLFYDYTFDSGKWQLFTELNTEYSFGKETSFANNTFLLAPGIFMSYFPSDKSTLLGFVQHSQRFGDFSQDYTALGLGGKYQLSNTLNIEALYSKFVRGTDNGLGQSFNIGLRALF